MTYYAITIDEMRALNGYELSDMAGCESPDSLSSAGAKLLECVRDCVANAISEGRVKLEDFNDDGQLSEIADDAPSVYTHARWEQFIDLGAYSEDPEIVDAWPPSLTEAAGMALYQICDRLAHTLCEAWRDGWACPVCTAEADEYGCDTDGCGNPAGALAGMAAQRLADLAAEAATAPESVVEPLPIRTPGVALAKAVHAYSDALTRPVDLSLVDLALANDMGARVTRSAMAHERRVARFRRRVWITAAILTVIGVTVVIFTV